MKLYFLSTVICLLACGQANAVPADLDKLPFKSCFIEAANKYKAHGVEVALLVAIAEKESAFNPKAYNGNNENNSFDVGIMQINSYWIKPPYLLASFYEPCFNIEFGAYVLADALSSHGYSWLGVGKYNARSLHKGYKYTSELYPIYKKWDRIFRMQKKR